MYKKLIVMFLKVCKNIQFIFIKLSLKKAFYISRRLFSYLTILCSNLNLSAIIAINSEFVGFPLVVCTVYPNN